MGGSDMEQKHTPGPWRYCPANNGHMIAGAKPGYLAEVRDCGSGDVHANARRIVACVNACEGLDTYLLENSGDIASAATAQAKYIQKIERQRDQLLEAILLAIDWIDAVPKDAALPPMPGFDRDYVDSIIATAKEQK